MNDSLLYEQSKTCPACERRFVLTRPRASACKVRRRDTDFRVVYEGIDPNLYSVWVCPRCGYAATETTFEQLGPAERERVRDALAGRPLPGGGQGERTVETAIAAYQQAIYLAEARKLAASSLAGLHLKLAWIYRGLEDGPAEQEHLAAARDLYRAAYDHERLGGPGKMSEATVAYLVGELCRRTGDYSTAINWFSKLVSDPRTKQEPQILSLAREQWYLARREAAGEAEEPAEPVMSRETKDETAAAGALPAAEEAALPSPPGPARATRPSYPSPPASRAREGKISSMIALHRDQVEWLQKVIAAADAVGGRLMLPDAVRAILDLAVLAVPPEELAVKNEEELRQRLVERLIQSGR